MSSVAWPFALATAAVASLLSADAVARSMRSPSPAARIGASYAAAFIGFKLGILAWVALLHHGWSAFSGAVLLRQFLPYGPRSEERRVGQAWFRTCRSRWLPTN